MIQKTKYTKDHIIKFTCGGIIFFYLMIKELVKKNEDECKNVSSPFRLDKYPSFNIYRNQSNNTWYFRDFGDPYIKGDQFDFAARKYDLSIKDKFPQILERMAIDLKMDTYDPVELEKLFNGQDCNISYVKLLGRTPYDPKNEYQEEVREVRRIIGVNTLKKTESELDDMERDFLRKYGITFETMQSTKSYFIMRYETVFEDGLSEYKLKPKGRMWIAYEFYGRYIKLYCPNPKKYWYVGNVPPDYYFGDEFPEQENMPLLLVGGEKDVLSLKSRGFDAACLSSEVAEIHRGVLKGWWESQTMIGQFDIQIMYDIDATGINQMKKLHQKHKYDYVVLPDWVREKGGKDISDFFALGGTADELKSLILPLIKPKKNGTHNIELLNTVDAVNSKRTSVRTANQRMADASLQPEIHPLFEMFIQKQEVAVLFGDTGVGKSILAMAVANAISKGESFLKMHNAYPPLKVLYYDFELSDKQFQKRYSNAGGKLYQFSDCLYIDWIDPAELVPSDKKEKFEHKLMKKVRLDIENTGAEFIVFDNLTYLTTYTAEDTQVALQLMKLLKELKSELGLTILVIAHTPKNIDPSGITLKALAGSKHISNFADSVFALGQAKNDTHLKYLMQVKASRSGEFKYDKNNVVLCEIDKKDDFLTFQFKGFGKESDLVKPERESEVDAKIEEAIKLKAAGKTYQQIADELKTSKSAVGRWLKDISEITNG